MKKNILIIAIILLVFGYSNVHSEEVYHRGYSTRVGEFELTNPNPDNPILYVLTTNIYNIYSEGQEDLGYWDYNEDINLESLGIDLGDYKVLSEEKYVPNNFTFDNDNLIRSVTKYSKTQKDFDRFYYKEADDSRNNNECYIEGKTLYLYYNFKLRRDFSILNLNQYSKLPNYEETLTEFFQLGSDGKEYINNLKNNNRMGYEYSHTDLYTCSTVIKLEKKPVKPPLVDTMGYAGKWKSSSDKEDYYTLHVEVSEKYKDKYFVALDYHGSWGGAISAGYIELKEGKQYLSKHGEWEYYEGEPYPTFYIELKNGKANITASVPFSIKHGDKLTFDLFEKGPKIFDLEKGLESFMHIYE